MPQAEQLTGPPESRTPWQLHQVNCSLDALRFVAPRLVETADVDTFDYDGLRVLVRRMFQLGAASRWVNRFTPDLAPEATLGTCNRYPFAHLMPGQRRELRTAYAALPKERIARNAPPVKIPPPRVVNLVAGANPLVVVESGCLFCGIDAQTVPAVTVALEGKDRVARDLWKPRRMTARRLGQSSPADVSGYLCPQCAEAVDHAGSVGPTALERALLMALAPEEAGRMGQRTIAGLVGYGALVVRARQHNPPEPDPRPNSQPWEHLGDPDALAEQLRAH